GDDQLCKLMEHNGKEGVDLLVRPLLEQEHERIGGLHGECVEPFERLDLIERRAIMLALGVVDLNIERTELPKFAHDDVVSPERQQCCGALRASRYDGCK